MTSCNSQFLRALLPAVTALIVSALVTCLVYIWQVQPEHPASAGNSQPRHLAPHQFKAIFGEIQTKGDRLQITKATQRGEEFHVLFTSKSAPFKAADHPIIQFRFDELDPSIHLNLIWRSGGRLFTRPLRQSPGSSSYLRIASDAGWQGVVTEIGFHIQGDPGDNHATLASLILHPHDWQSALRALISNWTDFRGWSFTSINVLYGSHDPAAYSPLVAAITWAGLALGLLAVFSRFRQPTPRLSYAIALLVPWIALDLLWQRDLSTQVEQTRAQFAGKSMHQKHLVDIDSSIYQYALKLKEEALPADNSRIFLLHDSTGHNFDRLKLQFYLLPHNIYNYGKRFYSDKLKAGDYILTLGQIPEITYQNGLLAWSSQHRIQAQLIDADPRGTLYLVTAISTPAVAGLTYLAPKNEHD